jgi:hypothetical protein
MSLTRNEKDELVPQSDAATALLRMPPAERLPKYRRNSLNAMRDVPQAVKDALRRFGQ